MNQKAQKLGLSQVKIYTPSGLDYKIELGRKDGRELLGKKPNVATAEDVASLCPVCRLRVMPGNQLAQMTTRMLSPLWKVLAVSRVF